MSHLFYLVAVMALLLSATSALSAAPREHVTIGETEKNLLKRRVEGAERSPSAVEPSLIRDNRQKYERDLVEPSASNPPNALDPKELVADPIRTPR